MPDLKEILRDRVKQRIDATGKTAHAVSKEIGANAGYVRDLMDPDKTGVPSAERLNKLAAALETTTDWLMGKVDDPAQPLSEISFRDAPLNWSGPPESRIPVLGTAFCDDLAVPDDANGELRVERLLLDFDHTVRLIERPPALWNAPDAYAIYFHGSSMEKRFYSGEIAVVDPRRPPSPGDFVVVQLSNGANDHIITVLVKQLIRTTSAYVELLQFNPEATFRIPRGQVIRMHRICSTNELLGG
ncbi:MAG: LexA family transcriptional regulator [Alphaproteobacteria bacterium]|nr:LexA family transcriptional regulator [Alphaproteobacteria bacterium]